MKWFFKPPRFIPPVEQIDSYNKQKARNREVFQRIGYYYIVDRLIESRAFEGAGATPFESVMVTDFEDVLGEISRMNAS